MTDRDRQRELDRLVARFLEALDAGNFDAIERLWERAAHDPQLESALTDAVEELVEELDREAQGNAEGMLEVAVRAAMPSAEVVRPPSGPLLAAEVADQIRRAGAPGLGAGDLVVNDRLLQSETPVPDDLGLSALVTWGTQFGEAPVPYWKQFQEAALKLLLRRETTTGYSMAARPSRPKRKGTTG